MPQLAVWSGAVNMIPDIAGGLGAALDFANVIANVFAGELEPKKAINDFYQLATGGSGAAASELPSLESVGNSVANSGADKSRDDVNTRTSTRLCYSKKR